MENIVIKVERTEYDLSQSSVGNCSGGCSGCGGSCSCGVNCANPGSCGK